MSAVADKPHPNPSPEGEGLSVALGYSPSPSGEGLGWGLSTRGKLTSNASLAPLVWFKSGGPTDQLFEPADVADLQAFLRATPGDVPVWPLGLGSNLIVRDGGVRGVTVRLGKAFAKVDAEGNSYIRAGGGAPGISVASAAREASTAGLEFLRGIPGTVGGAVRMNAGAYGRDVSDVLVLATIVERDGTLREIGSLDMNFSYRHTSLPVGSIIVEALFQGEHDDPAIIGAEMDRIAAEREASQPLRSRTGGSTFKNPVGKKAWQLVDEAGCRGLRIGDAQVSEKHCNFLLNLGSATSADIEALGEEVRTRVKAHSGVALEWEIQRVGEAHPRSAGAESPLPQAGGEK